MKEAFKADVILDLDIISQSLHGLLHKPVSSLPQDLEIHKVLYAFSKLDRANKAIINAMDVLDPIVKDLV